MKHQRGQILIIVILLSTVLITVALSISQITTQETQIAKLEEESKKAFAAAEAGIDKALKTAGPGGIVVIGQGAGELDLGAGITGKATIDDAPKTSFTTPLLKKDEQYTFYLSDYNKDINTFSNPWYGTLGFYFDSQSGGDCSGTYQPPTLELTFVYDDSPIKLKRFLLDPCSRISGNDILSTSKLTPPIEIEQSNFNYQATNDFDINSTDYPNVKVLLIRSLFFPTKIALVGR
jgi:hypothetical protein